jgi:hypothetical protein
MRIHLQATGIDDAIPANARLARASDFELGRVRSQDEWACVRGLRYEALRARGEIPEHSERIFEDAFDAALNTSTFQLSRNGSVIGTTRSSVSSALRRWPLPSSDVFGREIEAALGNEVTLVEASLTLADPAIDPKVALFHLFKAHMLQCAAQNADWLLVAVRDLQMGFYRRMFNMEILTGSGYVPGFATPRIVMGLEYRAQAPLLFKRLPALAISEAEARAFASA